MTDLADNRTVTGRRPRRADAERNHRRIVGAARAAVSLRGEDIVLEDVARDAGVGIGTLYRHFPNRQALLEAAFLDEARQLRSLAEQLANEDPADAFARYLRLHLEFGARGQSMGASVMNAKHTEGTPIQATCAEVRGAGERLLRRAQEAGAVRDDVEIGDVLRLVHGIVMAEAAAADPGRAPRMLDVVVAGLRP